MGRRASFYTCKFINMLPAISARISIYFFVQSQLVLVGVINNLIILGLLSLPTIWATGFLKILNVISKSKHKIRNDTNKSKETILAVKIKRKYT